MVFGFGFFFPLFLFTDDNLRPASGILFTNPPPSCRIRSWSLAFFQLPHQSMVNWSHPSLLFSHPQWCLGKSWGSTWSLALFSCLSSLESDAGRALLAGNNAFGHRGVLCIFSLSLSRKDNYLEIETMETRIHLLTWHLQMLHNKSLQVIYRHM